MKPRTPCNKGNLDGACTLLALALVAAAYLGRASCPLSCIPSEMALPDGRPPA